MIKRVRTGALGTLEEGIFALGLEERLEVMREHSSQRSSRAFQGRGTSRGSKARKPRVFE